MTTSPTTAAPASPIPTATGDMGKARLALEAIKAVTATTKDAVAGLSRIMAITRSAGVDASYSDLMAKADVALIVNSPRTEWRHLFDRADACAIPPEGWTCSRTPGHDGPCAASPIPTSVNGAGERETQGWDHRYRPLAWGEVILPTDECRRDDGTWATGICVGEKAPDPAYTSHRVYRRLIATLGADNFRINLAIALFEARHLAKLHGWSDKTRDYWLARADAALSPALDNTAVEGRLREVGQMAERGANNVFHELNRDPDWRPTRADYTTLGYLLNTIAGTTGIRATLAETEKAR